MPRDCNFVFAAGGRTSARPCVGSFCGPGDVQAWRLAADAWVMAAERQAANPEQSAWAAEMRRRYNLLAAGVPRPWALGSLVQDYITICQLVSCALVPVWEQRAEEERKKATEDNGDDEWTFPSLPTWPGLPSLPSLPSLPTWPGLPSFGWPTIPNWVWWVGGGLLLLYFAPLLFAARPEGRER